MENIILLLFIVGVLWVCYFLGRWMGAQTTGANESTLSMIQQTTYQLVMVVVTNAVIATNEEFVKLYKGTEEWTDEKKKEAFSKTMNRVIEMLGEDMLNTLNETFGDVDELLTSLILRTVNDENSTPNGFYR